MRITRGFSSSQGFGCDFLMVKECARGFFLYGFPHPLSYIYNKKKEVLSGNGRVSYLRKEKKNITPFLPSVICCMC